MKQKREVHNSPLSGMCSGQPVEFSPAGALWENGWFLLGSFKDSGEVMAIFLQHWEGGKKQRVNKEKEVTCCH